MTVVENNLFSGRIEVLILDASIFGCLGAGAGGRPGRMTSQWRSALSGHPIMECLLVDIGGTAWVTVFRRRNDYVTRVVEAGNGLT